MPVSHRRIILESLNAVGASFDRDELAYLAATSKVEQPVRDRLAWILQQRVPRVGREYWLRPRRVDLVLADDGGEPVALVELKSMYSFDGLKDGGEEYVELVRSDMDRLGSLDVDVAPSAERYGVLLATYLGAEVPKESRPFIKYWRQSNRFLNADGLGFRTAANAAVRAGLRTIAEEVDLVRLGEGTYLDIPVIVDAWLIGPVVD